MSTIGNVLWWHWQELMSWVASMSLCNLLYLVYAIYRVSTTGHALWWHCEELMTWVVYASLCSLCMYMGVHVAL